MSVVLKYQQITITYNPATDEMVERHVKVGSDDQPDVYHYKINPDGYLVMVSQTSSRQPTLPLCSGHDLQRRLDQPILQACELSSGGWRPAEDTCSQ